MLLNAGCRRLVFAVLTILLAGCMTKARDVVPTQGLPDVVPSNSPITTQRVIEPLANVAASPTVTRRPTITASPTWTVVPTLDPTEAFDVFLSLYNDNGGCELPCWWGIEPGVTSWPEARTKLSSLTRLMGPYGKKAISQYELSIVVPEKLDAVLGSMSATIAQNGEMVTGISVNSKWVSRSFDYSLPGLLRRFGQPDEVWLRVGTDTPFTPEFEIDLVYLKKGILVNATGTVEEKNANLLAICFDEFGRGQFPPALVLWRPSPAVTFANFHSSTMGRDDTPSREFRVIESWTEGFTSDDFYAAFLNPEIHRCFDIARTPR